MVRIAAAAALAFLLAGCAARSDDAAAQVERGRYLVSIMGCSDCHTPGGFSPKPDMTRFLGGSDTDFDLPGLGVFVPPNLTPDKQTGIGSWTSDQIVAAITTGTTPDGRILAPAMPWPGFAHLSHDDALSVAVYLKSLPPVRHAVPGPGAARPCVDKAVQCITQREAPAP
jgi:mono/diheme cytochrome c family protein